MQRSSVFHINNLLFTDPDEINSPSVNWSCWGDKETLTFIQERLSVFVSISVRHGCCFLSPSKASLCSAWKEENNYCVRGSGHAAAKRRGFGDRFKANVCWGGRSRHRARYWKQKTEKRRLNVAVWNNNKNWKKFGCFLTVKLLLIHISSYWLVVCRWLK